MANSQGVLVGGQRGVSAERRVRHGRAIGSEMSGRLELRGGIQEGGWRIVGKRWTMMQWEDFSWEVGKSREPRGKFLGTGIAGQRKGGVEFVAGYGGGDGKARERKRQNWRERDSPWAVLAEGGGGGGGRGERERRPPTDFAAGSHGNSGWNSRAILSGANSDSDCRQWALASSRGMGVRRPVELDWARRR